MKYIKTKIFVIILMLVALLFILVSVVVNIVIPKHYENEARKAIQYEYEYIQKTATSDEDIEYDVKYFSGNILFIDTSSYNSYENIVNNRQMTSAQIAQREIMEYCNNHKISKNKCYTYETEDGYYIFMEYDDYLWNENNPEAIMYINIRPLVKYTSSVNGILLLLFMGVTFAMSIIGVRLGSKIETTQNNQLEFFQNSSHELKTPLMSIQGYAEGIQMGIVEPKKSAGIIMEESERMTALVEELLAISKIDANEIKLDIIKTDAREILYDCLRTLEPAYKNENIEVIPDFDGEPVIIKCDEVQMRKALINVISNGLRHCNAKLNVSCKVCNDDVVICVEDDGDGINEEDIPHIFDRFYTGKNGNTGIGLALTQKIIEMHKGKILAQNTENGAEFIINLPGRKQL